MRQRNDKAFIELLNRIRTANQTDDIKVIQSRSVSPDDPNYPSHALHIWAENSSVDKHNNEKLEQLAGPLFVLKAKDQFPPNVKKQDIDKVLARKRSETGGLDLVIHDHIKEGARVMLTSNISIADKLINGQMGTVFKVDVNPTNQKPTIVYIKFDDPNAGKNLLKTTSNLLAREHQVVPIN
ncbi:uncharacterized protein LOC114532812 [Dendronephthya gigantea]|uniref:uncharacterized protein LOC114532812 n=1 Tax=Dendronephthya gigantea TaxID=151771 RepID=UPI00106CA497|nr:uncharacterized protein LOC114532812 [Dendronephthya gigantea]